jgi:hypothetical protein
MEASESKQPAENRRTGLVGAAAAIGGAVVAGVLARKLGERKEDAPQAPIADALVELLGFAFFGDVPDRLPSWGTPDVKRHALTRLEGLWPTLSEDWRSFYARLPATRDVIFDGWRRSARAPHVQASWVDAAQQLFPAKKAEVDRERAALEEAMRRRVAQEAAAQQAAAEAVRRSHVAEPAPRGSASRAASPGFRIDPFVVGMNASMATTQRLQRQQLDILSGRRGPGMAG